MISEVRWSILIGDGAFFDPSLLIKDLFQEKQKTSYYIGLMANGLPSTIAWLLFISANNKLLLLLSLYSVSPEGANELS